jgi:hypothetical protein
VRPGIARRGLLVIVSLGLLAGACSEGASPADQPDPDPVAVTVYLQRRLQVGPALDPARLRLWPPGPNGLYGWGTTLEIRDGRPALYLLADQVAG